MLYEFLFPFAEDYPLFNVIQYITFRSGAATLTALLIAFLIGKPLIKFLRMRQGKGQPIRQDGPEGHIVAKAGTPTMGGFLILLAMSISILLWGNLQNPYVWTVFLTTLGFGLVGFVDDYRKVVKQTSEGLGGRAKLLVEFVIAAVAVIAFMRISGSVPSAPENFGTSLALPFFKDLLINMGPAYIAFGMLVVVFTGNAVNLTDGLDGLAIVPVMIAAASFAVIAYLAGNAIFSGYLNIHFTPGTGELTVLLAALLGASLGFLWWNAPPAMVFMGDTGSLALGGMLGATAVAVKHEIVLGVIGGLFFLEALSVMVQVASFRLTGKRVFRMAPIHHHFEKLGWQEPTIVIRFWIIAVVLALIGLSTLKLR